MQCFHDIEWSRSIFLEFDIKMIDRIKLNLTRYRIEIRSNRTKCRHFDFKLNIFEAPKGDVKKE